MAIACAHKFAYSTRMPKHPHKFESCDIQLQNALFTFILLLRWVGEGEGGGLWHCIQLDECVQQRQGKLCLQ